MHSFNPTITLSECADEIVARDRVSQKQVDAAYDSLDKSLELQKDTYQSSINEMSEDIADLEADIEQLEAKLEDQFEDNKFLDDEIYSLNDDIKDAAMQMESLMADFEVIGMNQLDTYTDWADRAYEAMRDITNQFPIIHYVSDYSAVEDSYHDINEDTADYSDYDQPFNAEDYDDRWQEQWNENAIEYADQDTAEVSE